jgi:hypothetical protein
MRRHAIGIGSLKNAFFQAETKALTHAVRVNAGHFPGYARNLFVM